MENCGKAGGDWSAWCWKLQGSGDVCARGHLGPLCLLLADPHTMLLGLGMPMGGHIYQVLWLRIGPRMLHEDDAYGTEGIQ